MPKSPPDGAEEWPVPAGATTRFPSLPVWEDPWERKVDLTRLRANAVSFVTFRKLIEDSKRPAPELLVGVDLVAQLVEPLALDEISSSRLRDDAMLVTDWFLQPRRLAHLHLGQSETINALKPISGLARDLNGFLSLHGREIEELFASLPLEGCPGADVMDLLRFSREAALLSRAASEADRKVRPGHGGRAAEVRRDVSLALLTWATEQATGKRVSISAGTRERGGRHFVGESGHFVYRIMNLLTGKSEKQLTRLFDRLRTKQPKQSD